MPTPIEKPFRDGDAYLPPRSVDMSVAAARSVLRSAVYNALGQYGLLKDEVRLVLEGIINEIPEKQEQKWQE